MRCDTVDERGRDPSSNTSLYCSRKTYKDREGVRHRDAWTYPLFPEVEESKSPLQLEFEDRLVHQDMVFSQLERKIHRLETTMDSLANSHKIRRIVQDKANVEAMTKMHGDSGTIKSVNPVEGAQEKILSRIYDAIKVDEKYGYSMPSDLPDLVTIHKFRCEMPTSADKFELALCRAYESLPAACLDFIELLVERAYPSTRYWKESVEDKWNAGQKEYEYDFDGVNEAEHAHPCHRGQDYWELISEYSKLVEETNSCEAVRKLWEFQEAVEVDTVEEEMEEEEEIDWMALIGDCGTTKSGGKWSGGWGLKVALPAESELERIL